MQHITINSYEFVRQSFTKDIAACLTLKVSMPTEENKQSSVKAVLVQRESEWNTNMWDSDLLRKWTRVFLYKCKVFGRGRPVNKLIGSTFTLERDGVTVSTQQLFWVTNVPCSRKSNRLEQRINQHCIYWKQQTSKHVFCKVLYNNDEYVMKFNVSNMSNISIKKRYGQWSFFT